MKDVILLDCDGVLLSWEKGFRRWMYNRGYRLLNPQEYCIENRYNLDTKKAADLVSYFNESIYAGFLEPQFSNTYKNLNNLKTKFPFFKFVVVTCFGGCNLLLQMMRKENLVRDIFKDIDFDIHFLEPTDSKLPTFECYQDSAICGIDDNSTYINELNLLNIPSFLVDHGYYKESDKQTLANDGTITTNSFTDFCKTIENIFENIK